MRAASPAEIFLHGQFLGAADVRKSVSGFELAALVPTVPEHDVREHAHADAHFVVLLEGRYLSSAFGAEPVSQGPTLIYNPPGTTHRDRFRGIAGRFVTVSVSASAWREYRAAVRLPDYACACDGRALTVALRIVDALASGADTPSLELESLCAELLASTAAGDAIDGGAPPAWLRRARELLHDTCGGDLRLSQVAAAAGVHSVHLTRSFRRHFRCTPGEYVRRCRLTRAAALLGAGQLGLGEIAAACGYFDQAHFSRSFKRAYGVSPRAYRTRAADGHAARFVKYKTGPASRA